MDQLTFGDDGQNTLKSRNLLFRADHYCAGTEGANMIDWHQEQGVILLLSNYVKSLMFAFISCSWKFLMIHKNAKKTFVNTCEPETFIVCAMW